VDVLQERTKWKVALKDSHARIFDIDEKTWDFDQSLMVTHCLLHGKRRSHGGDLIKG
jgi:hypothetical protein